MYGMSNIKILFTLFFQFDTYLITKIFAKSALQILLARPIGRAV